MTFSVSLLCVRVRELVQTRGQSMPRNAGFWSSACLYVYTLHVVGRLSGSLLDTNALELRQ